MKLLNTMFRLAPRGALLGSIASVGLAGCLVPLGGGEVGELRVGWTFGEDDSCAAVGVETVSVQVASSDGAGGVEADCLTGAVVVPDLPAGSYDIFLDAQGLVAWTGKEELEVEAGFTSDEGIVKLKPVVGPEGTSVSLLWAFDGVASCASAGVDQVDVQVTLDGDLVSARTFACTDGGATLIGLPAGALDFAISGRDGDVVTHATNTTVTTSPFRTDLGTVDLLPIRARIELAWTFEGDPRCEVAGVTDVSVQVINDAGTTVGGLQVDCLAGRLTLSSLPAEHLTFVVEGLAGSTRRWQNSIALTLTAGDNPDVTVPLEPAFATALVRWRFADAGGTADCAAAGVTSISVQVVDPAGAVVAGTNFPCAVGTGVIEGLSIGAHRFVTDGFNAAGTLVAQDTTGTPRGVTQTLDLGDNVVEVTLE